jgi:hypothetical protein
MSSSSSPEVKKSYIGKKHVNLENEQKLLSYFFRYPEEAMLFSENDFVDPVSRNIFSGISALQEQNLSFDLDTLKTLCANKDNSVKYDFLLSMQERFSDFSNIDFVKKTARNDALKHRIHERLSQELLGKMRQADYIEVQDLQHLLDDIQQEIANLSGRAELLTWREFADEHKEILEQRGMGKLVRSLGFPNLDIMLARPGAEEEFSVLAGPKGSSKSICMKTMENNLLTRKTCVLSINLEMSKRSNADRIICLKGGLVMRDLQKKDMDPRVKAAAVQILSMDIPNYLYCPSDTMDLGELDALIYKAKAMFSRAGVLPPDGYIFIGIDSLDMIKGFEDPRAISQSVNRLHSIVRKHKSHALCLLQLNENKLRSETFKVPKTPEELDHILKFTDADIYGGSYYSARARAVFIMNRPLHWKKKFFPEFAERWNQEEKHSDIIQVTLAKSNDGSFNGYAKFNFEGSRMRVTVPEEDAVVAEGEK